MNHCFTGTTAEATDANDTTKYEMNGNQEGSDGLEMGVTERNGVLLMLQMK